MKKIYLFLLFALTTATLSFAQKNNKLSVSHQNSAKTTFAQAKDFIPTQGIDRTNNSVSQTKKAPARASLVNPPLYITPEEWYVSGAFYAWGGSSWVDITDEVPTANVIIDGSNMYIQNLAYWFPDAWIKGTISGSTVTFPSATFVGSDEYGDEYLVGSEDGENLSAITFTYDADAQVLTADTYIMESGSDTSLAIYCYWDDLTLSKDEPEGVPVVETPEDLVTEPWVMISTSETYDEDTQEYYPVTYTQPVNVGFYGDEIYVQGLNSYLPEAWVKGTVSGNNATFEGAQYYGKVEGYSLYFFGVTDEDELADVVFTINDTQDKLTADKDIITNLGADEYYSIQQYSNVVLVKVVEKAGIPQTPTIESVEDSEYGPYLEGYIPLIDTNGNPMLSDKVTYRLYKDINGQVEVFTFVAGDFYEKIAEDVTEIPYDFTEDWDIYVGASTIYLYGEDYDSWNKVGLQSIYYGGGEVHESEIAWFEIKPYSEGEEVAYSFDFNAMPEDTPTSNNGNEGDITSNLDIVEGDVTLTISPSDGSTPNRWWKNYATSQIQLRVYGGTMTFTTESGDNIIKIEFYYGNWNEDNSADSGKISVGTDVATWTGSASTVTTYIGGNTQLNKVVVYVDDTNEATGIHAVEIPVNDGIIYNLQGQRVSNPQRGIYIMNGKKFYVK